METSERDTNGVVARDKHGVMAYDKDGLTVVFGIAANEADPSIYNVTAVLSNSSPFTLTRMDMKIAPKKVVHPVFVALLFASLPPGLLTTTNST